MLLAVVVAAVLGIAGYGAEAIDPAGGYDAGAFLDYAEILEREGRLPTRAETYEFATPPGYLWAAVQLRRAGGSWSWGQVLSIAWTAGLILLAWLLARELWPRRPLLWAGAAAATAALPIVIRLGTMFHPEPQFAFFAVAAILLCVRAARVGWSWPLGAGVGIALGMAALTRPTAVVVVLGLALAVLLVGRRDALRFAAAAAAALFLIAGPWWAYQTGRYGNPIQSNLERYILDEGQPREFYVSAPVRDLVLHPYRPAFAGQLWPQFHADLWSDWFGGQHGYWNEQPSTATRLFVSSQSVLGLLATPLVIAGLVVLARRREFAGVALALLVGLSWIGFVVQLVRFPQAGGDPIKSSYMLYLAPVFAIAALAAGDWLWRRGRAWRVALVAWPALYALSYAGFLLTSW